MTEVAYQQACARDIGKLLERFARIGQWPMTLELISGNPPMFATSCDDPWKVLRDRLSREAHKAGIDVHLEAEVVR